jgi:hypothetical protein
MPSTGYWFVTVPGHTPPKIGKPKRNRAKVKAGRKASHRKR